MKHRKKLKKLNRTAEHRRSLLRNLATSLVLHNRIETTVPKAKALKRVADKLITLGKEDTLHNRRQAMRYLFAINRTESGNAHKLTAVHRLFTEIAPRYVERHGGYTRVVRSGTREGDKAPLAIIEFVEAGAPKTEKRRKRRVVKAESHASKGAGESAAAE